MNLKQVLDFRRSVRVYDNQNPIDPEVVKNILGLPRAAEINMIVSCGVRKGDQGIYGERYRVPFNQVYKRM